LYFYVKSALNYYFGAKILYFHNILKKKFFCGFLNNNSKFLLNSDVLLL